MRLPQTNINPDTKITVKRILPVPGQVLVQRGQPVQPLQTVARAEIPRRYRIINIAHLVGSSALESQALLKPIGAYVAADEPIAILKGRLPFFRRTVRAPVAGRITTFGPGWVLLETERTITEIQAFVNGVVARIIPHQGVVIEARGAIISAACGFGGEAYGRLKRLVDSPFDMMAENALDDRVAQAIVIGGRSIDATLLRRAETMHVRGIIVGSIDASLLSLEPAPQVRVVATEGFGDIPMSPYIFGQLTGLIGRAVSIRGRTAPLVVPIHQQTETDSPLILATTASSITAQRDSIEPTAPTPGLDIKVGSRVRITRGRLLGAIGAVSAIPKQPQAIESGIVAAGAYVTVAGTAYFVPWLNLQQVS